MKVYGVTNISTDTQITICGLNVPPGFEVIASHYSENVIQHFIAHKIIEFRTYESLAFVMLPFIRPAPQSYMTSIGGAETSTAFHI